MTEPKLWTVERVADELTLSRVTVYRMVRDKTIPFVRLGTAVRFHPEEIRSWIAKRSVPAVGK